MRVALRDGIYSGAVQFSGRSRWMGGQYDIGNWRHRAQVVRDFTGKVSRGILARAEEHDAREDYTAGTREVERLADTLIGACVHKAFDEMLIRECAENYSRLCGRMLTLEGRAEFARGMRVEPPAGRTVTRDGAIKRLDDPMWWRRQLRRTWTRAAEGGLREIGVIRKGREPYASDLAVKHRRAQKRRTREFLERSRLTNLDTGEQLEMRDVAERSLSNPALRRGEFMCRVRGFEEIAADFGHVAEFVTLTCPSFFHAQLASAGANPAYERATVREAQAWLCRMWARARSKLKRLSVLFYGFRIAEPHHDATPHWHCLFFVQASNVDTLRRVLRMAWLSEHAGEAGAGAHRVKFEAIDPAKGSAVGYVAKYVSKNIDGAGAIGNERDSETDSGISEGIGRVDAWASINGIRQFQQIGGPAVGLWREARRIHDPCSDTDLERVRRRADAGDWCGFIQAVGGIHAGRRTNVTLEKVATAEANRYGECRPDRVVGLRCASAVVISRPHRWRIEPTHQRGGACYEGRKVTGETGTDRPAAPFFSGFFSPLGPVAITVRGASSAGEPSAWSNPNETSQAGP